MDSHDQSRPFGQIADHALTHPLPYSTPQSERKHRKSVPPAVGKIVAELGFRFRPSAQTDLEAHAHTLRLLAEDLADVPASILEVAAQRWAATRPFLPKAAEIIALSREIQAASVAGTDAALSRLQEHCDRLNAAGGAMYWYVAGRAPDRRVECSRRTL